MESLEISFLQRDPTRLEDLCRLLPVPQQDALYLRIGVDVQHHAQIIVWGKQRVAGIGTLHDCNCRWLDRDRGLEGLCMTIVWTVREGVCELERKQNLIEKALMVYVFPRDRKALGRSLLGTQEKVVHVEQYALKPLLQVSPKGGFA